MKIWGKPPTFIEAKYVTKDGETRTSLLLASGWWGLARYKNKHDAIFLSRKFQFVLSQSCLLHLLHLLFNAYHFICTSLTYSKNLFADTSIIYLRLPPLSFGAFQRCFLIRWHTFIQCISHSFFLIELGEMTPDVAISIRIVGRNTAS